LDSAAASISSIFVAGKPTSSIQPSTPSIPGVIAEVP
jgi:hypothetical protein